jgi:hypothetical protein
MSYDRNSGMVIYRSKMHATRSRNYQLMPALKWLRLLNHVPDKYEHSGSVLRLLLQPLHGRPTAGRTGRMTLGIIFHDAS